ncbi:MAG: M1 family metallopeptidase [Pyrinomonadaceae bacterium]
MKPSEPHSFRFLPKTYARLLLATAFLLLSVFNTEASRAERLIESWKPVHYRVFLTFDDQLSRLTNARTELTFISLKERLTNIDLDFGEMPVDSITVNHKVVAFERSPGHLIVKLSQPARRGARLRLDVYYHGTPKDGLILTTDKSGLPSAVGDNWPNRVHHWIPCLDHPSAKATVSFSLTVPVRLTTVANGKLVGVRTNSDSTRTWTWSEGVPIPPYCMIIAVGEFALLAPSPRVTPSLAYYVPQVDREFAPKGFAPAKSSLNFFTQTIAPYPYEKLALIVGATQFGGMENSSAIVFPSTIFDSRRVAEPLSNLFGIREGIVEVLAHEIAHQWFGDSVTESTWSDLWLSEGFATYFAGLFLQRYEGEAVFQRYMQDAADKYLSYEKKVITPLHDTETEDLFKLLNANNYEKGSWVLHMLRSEVGDKNFFAAIRAYYNGHRNATATTEDLRAALEKSSGRNLKLFFERWVYGTGHPTYALSWEWKGKEKTVRLILTQLQPGAPFPNSVPIEISTSGGRHRLVLQPVDKQTTKELRLDTFPSRITLDPDNSILKEVNSVKNDRSAS